jgi:hypothetical protein
VCRKDPLTRHDLLWKRHFQPRIALERMPVLVTGLRKGLKVATGQPVQNVFPILDRSFDDGLLQESGDFGPVRRAADEGYPAAHIVRVSKIA